MILEILKISLFSHILEILDIGFSLFSHILEILDIGFSIFSYPGNTDGGRAAPGARLRGLG